MKAVLCALHLIIASSSFFAHSASAGGYKKFTVAFDEYLALAMKQIPELSLAIRMAKRDKTDVYLRSDESLRLALFIRDLVLSDEADRDKAKPGLFSAFSWEKRDGLLMEFEDLENARPYISRRFMNSIHLLRHTYSGLSLRIRALPNYRWKAQFVDLLSDRPDPETLSVEDRLDLKREIYEGFWLGDIHILSIRRFVGSYESGYDPALPSLSASANSRTLRELLKVLEILDKHGMKISMDSFERFEKRIYAYLRQGASLETRFRPWNIDQEARDRVELFLEHKELLSIRLPCFSKVLDEVDRRFKAEPVTESADESAPMID